MGLPALDIEPNWSSVKKGNVVSLLATVVIHDATHQRHLLRSACSQILFVFSGELPKVEAVSLLEVKIDSCEKGIRICAADGYVLPHDTPELSSVYNAVEVCAGIGCLGTGLSTAGFVIQASNELRTKLVDFQKLQGKPNVIEGDLGEIRVVAELHKAHQGPGVVAGGFSCQPWSFLGDRGMANDDRASSLVYLLRAAYFLRSHSVIMECVCGAGKDVEVQKTIKKFCQLTGYTMSSVDLSLGTIFPAKRDRWWCVLTCPTWNRVTLRPLPVLDPLPLIGELLPQCPIWPPGEEAQLALDLYETNKHETYGGLCNKVVSLNAQLSTALHGWANQLAGCPCGCRKHAMNEQRFETKGLFAALVLLEGVFDSYKGQLPRTRHMHPWEMAVLHGMLPNQDFSQGMRLGICAMGQMASPIQSNWISAQLLQSMESRYELPVVLPEVRLGNHLKEFFTQIQQFQPDLVVLPPFQKFVTRLWACLESSIMSQQVHAPIAMPSFALGSVNVADVGRRDAQEGKEIDIKEKEEAILAPSQVVERHSPALVETDPGSVLNMPPTPFQAMPGQLSDCPGPSLPPVEDEEEKKATRTGREDLKKIEVNQPPDRAGEPGQDDNNQPAVETQELKEEPHGPNPCLMPLPAFQAMPDPQPMGSGPSQPREAVPATVLASGHPDDALEPMACVERAPFSVDLGKKEPLDQVFSPRGGFHAFALTSGIYHAQSTGPTPVNPPPGQLSPTELQELLRTPDEPVEVENVASMDASVDGSRAHTHRVYVIRPDDLTPMPVQVPTGTTVGSITVAEERNHVMPQPIRVTDVVGNVLSLGSETYANQQVFLNVHETPSSHAVVPAPLLDHAMVTRMQMLYLQGPWVELHEYHFYLRAILPSEKVTIIPPKMLPRHTLDDELETILRTWASECTAATQTKGSAASALLIDDHWLPVLVKQNAMGYSVATTDSGRAWMEIAFHLFMQQTKIEVSPLPLTNDNDCGFQSIGWIKHHLAQANDAHVKSVAVTARPAQKLLWRELFQAQLGEHTTQVKLVKPCECRFGGGGQGEVVQHVVDLLSQHGVPQQVVQERADKVIETLGRMPVAQTMRSSQPWRDLKALANASRPKLQLVPGIWS